MLSIDTSRPYGVPLFCPIDEAYYISPISVFSDVERSGATLCGFHNRRLRAIGDAQHRHRRRRPLLPSSQIASLSGPGFSREADVCGPYNRHLRYADPEWRTRHLPSHTLGLIIAALLANRGVARLVSEHG
jgi:hypothetical protein